MLSGCYVKLTTTNLHPMLCEKHLLAKLCVLMMMRVIDFSNYAKAGDKVNVI